MSFLRMYPENDSAHYEEIGEHDWIAGCLNRYGIRFERWEAEQDLSASSTQDEILAAYEKPVQQLMRDCGFVTADVISVNSDTPNHPDIRKKFLNEHRHTEDEARFFVDGCGLFYIHMGKRVLMVMCEKGDFISIPAGTKHWFDMGPTPLLKCIRTFTTPEGWVAEFTDSDIASRFPRFESVTPASNRPMVIR